MTLNSSVRENGDIVVTSGKKLTIETAADFARILREALNEAENVAIEFEDDVELDLTAVQIICSACKSAAGVGKSFSYYGLQPHSMAEMIIRSGAERYSVCKHNNNSTCIWFGGVN